MRVVERLASPDDDYASLTTSTNEKGDGRRRVQTPENRTLTSMASATGKQYDRNRKPQRSPFQFVNLHEVTDNFPSPRWLDEIYNELQNKHESLKQRVASASKNTREAMADVLELQAKLAEEREFQRNIISTMTDIFGKDIADQIEEDVKHAMDTGSLPDRSRGFKINFGDAVEEPWDEEEPVECLPTKADKPKDGPEIEQRPTEGKDMDEMSNGGVEKEEKGGEKATDEEEDEGGEFQQDNSRSPTLQPAQQPVMHDTPSSSWITNLASRWFGSPDEPQPSISTSGDPVALDTVASQADLSSESGQLIRKRRGEIDQKDDSVQHTRLDEPTFRQKRKRREN